MAGRSKHGHQANNSAGGKNVGNAGSPAVALALNIELNNLYLQCVYGLRGLGRLSYLLLNLAIRLPMVLS